MSTEATNAAVSAAGHQLVTAQAPGSACKPEWKILGLSYATLETSGTGLKHQTLHSLGVGLTARLLHNPISLNTRGHQPFESIYEAAGFTVSSRVQVVEAQASLCAHGLRWDYDWPCSEQQ